MDPEKPIPEVILFFRTTFSIVLALALAEAFKQSVNDKAANQNDTVICWNRLPALFSFLLLILPFYQGMSRYFFFTYANLSKLPQPYSAYLLIDGVALLAETALFFVMSRALAPAQWITFYLTVLALLYVDSLWIFITALHGAPLGLWSILNLVFGGIVVALVLYFRNSTNYMIPAYFGMSLIFVRTILDYVLIWDFYFPAK